MKFLISIILSCILISTAMAQKSSEMVDWLSKRAIKIKSINPNDTSFIDLSKWGESLKDVRLVLLGEQDHSDGATFLAKTRLIKYLHEELDFDVIAFETGFYDMYKLNTTFKDDNNFTTIVKQNIQPVWGKYEETQPLFDYIKTQTNSEKTVFLAGFDCSNRSYLYKEQYVNDLNKFISKHNLHISGKQDYRTFITRLNDFTNGKWNEILVGFNLQDRLLMYKVVDTIKHEIESINHPSDIELQFWLQEIKNLKADMEVIWGYDIKSQGGYIYNNTRDIQMADNLRWLVKEKYPEKKIIVWAHNYHILKNPELVKESKYFRSTKLKVMGDIISDHLVDSSYHLGFISYEGEYRSYGHDNEADYTVNIRKPSKKSFEHHLEETGYDNLLISFTNQSRLPAFFSSPFIMRGVNHSLESKGEWIHVFDGIFYIKKMTPSSKQVQSK